MKELDELRSIISEIDSEMVSLFEKRMEECRKLALFKIKNGMPILDSEQETKVKYRNEDSVSDPVQREYYTLFLQNLISLSKAYQARLMKGMKVACCDVDGSSASAAAKKTFPDAEIIAYCDFESAYKACENGETDIAVLPVDNKFSGDIGEVMDLTFSGPLYINMMVELNGRFAIFSRSMNPTATEGSDNRFILVFTVRNDAGSLAKALNIIGLHGYNLTNLHSRSQKGPFWNHYVFAELEGNVETSEGKELLRQLGSVCEKMKLVGVYKKQYL